MGNRTTYEYPTVRPPISQPQPAHHNDTRFSWMNRDSTLINRQQTQISRAPPVQTPAPLPAPENVSKPQFKLFPEQYPEQYPQQIRSGENLQSPTQQFPQTHTLSQLQQQQTADSSQEEKKESKSKMEFSKDQAQQAIQQYQAPSNMVIEPDENPLTPNTPRFNLATSPLVAAVPRSPMYGSNQGPPQESPIGGTWAHGLCSCAEPAICMTSIFCPCITYGKVQHMYNLRTQRKDTTNMLGYQTFNGACIGFGILCGINGILASIQRSRLRSSYEMGPESGNFISDCIKGCCCCCCVVAQNEKEMKHREQDWRADKGYVTPQRMTFPTSVGR